MTNYWEINKKEKNAAKIKKLQQQIEQGIDSEYGAGAYGTWHNELPDKYQKIQDKIEKLNEKSKEKKNVPGIGVEKEKN